MFEGIRRRWAKARVDVATKEVADILRRYEQMHRENKYWVLSAFDAVLSGVEDQLGPVAHWTAEQKKQTARQILESSRQAFSARGNNIVAEASKVGAHGGALLSLYLEVQTLPGNEAIRVVGIIENWRKQAASECSIQGGKP